MTCTLKIAVDILTTPMGYKYVVYSPKMAHENDCFEYLHSFVGKTPHYRNPNRCLIINPADRHDGMFLFFNEITNFIKYFKPQEVSITSMTSLFILRHEK